MGVNNARRSMRGRFMASALALAVGGVVIPQAAMAHTAPDGQIDFDIPAQDLNKALLAFTDRAGLQIFYDLDKVAGKHSGAVRGGYAPMEALSQLLVGTGLTFRATGNRVTLEPAPQSSDAIQLGPVRVEGEGQSRPRAPATSVIGSLPEVYAGGKVARGGQMGVLGNRDYMDAPLSITSYTAKAIEDQQAVSVAELLALNDPSVRNSTGSTNRYDAVTIRGLRVPTSDASLNGLYGLTPNWRVIPDPIERVEVIKGPTALLNGIAPGGSVGGGVNIVTKRADDRPLTRVTGEYMSDARFGGHVDLGRRFGSEGQFGIRINGAYRAGKPPHDREDTRNTAASVNLDYRGDRLRLSADLIYQDDWIGVPERGSTIIAGITLPKPPRARTNMSQYYDFGDAQSITGLGRAEYDVLDNVTVYLAGGANGFNFSKRETNGHTIIRSNGDATADDNYMKGKYRTNTEEAGIRARFETGPVSHQLTINVNRLHQSYDFGQDTYAVYTTNIYNPVLFNNPRVPISSFPVGRSTELTLRSIAAADTLSFQGDLVQLTLGVRRQNVRSNNYSSTTGARTRHYDESATTPMVGLVVRPSSVLSFYGNYIEALTPGPVPPTGAANRAEIFPPFKSKQYEIGAKLDFGSFGATLAAFQLKVPSGITDPVTKNFSLDGEQRNRGIEFQGFGEITQTLRVVGGITYLDGKLTRTQGGVNDGHDAIGVSHVQANLGVDWDTGFIPGLALNGRLIYTGKTWLDAANTYRIPAWTRVNLGARYEIRSADIPLTFRLDVANVFNNSYWEENPSGYVTRGVPRTLFFSASADF